MKKFVTKILIQSKGDDLERAEHAFKNYTEKQMDSEYGQSGKTARQILTDYRVDRTDINNAIMWVKNIK